jgi:enoyl-CoA hydratase
MPPVRVEHREPGIAVVVLDDPERRNAMTVEMGDALQAAAGQLRDREDVRAVVVTGEPPAFSAGGDLGMLEDLARRTREDGFDATETMREFYARFLTLRDLPVPVIAAVNGHAVGAGLCVALACDLLLVAEDAKVGLNFAKLGLHPGMGGSWMLPNAVGRQQAARLLYTGRLISGTEATSLGMALESLPRDEVLPTALGLAEEIAQASPVVVRQVKQTIGDPADDLDGALAREAACQAVNYGTDDLSEGLAAGRDRRAPSFTGR